MPGSILAGCLGLALGPSALDLLPLHVGVLEAGVYHGLAIVFIAVGLQAPPASADGGRKPAKSARSMAFAITTMVALQTLIGLVLVLVLGWIQGAHFHPGLGLLLPLGFEQGPGQALSLGAAWEKSGLKDGAQVGLIVAAIGFGWAIAGGLPLVAWAKRRGLFEERHDHRESDEVMAADTALGVGSVELLTLQVVAIAVVYLATWGVCSAAARALSFAPDIAAMVWGFHFIVGAAIAVGVRSVARFVPGPPPLHTPLLGRISNLTVDLITVAALAAVQLAVLNANLLAIGLITAVGGVVTLVACVWLSRRAFPDAPFEHAVLWFGMSTGTLPMGLALLRMVDPELRSPAPMSAVFGSALAVAGVAPIVLFLHPMAITAWPDAYPTGGWLVVGITAAYLVATVALWRMVGGLRIGRERTRAGRA